MLEADYKGDKRNVIEREKIRSLPQESRTKIIQWIL